MVLRHWFVVASPSRKLCFWGFLTFSFPSLPSYWVRERERERELLLSWSKMGWLGTYWDFWFLTLTLVKLTSLRFFPIVVSAGVWTFWTDMCGWYLWPSNSVLTRVIEAGSSNYIISWIGLAQLDSFFIIIPCFSTQIIVWFFLFFSIWQ